MKLTRLVFIFYCLQFSACKTVYKADPGRSAATRQAIIPSDTLAKKQHVGTDFLAEGTDPVPWTLELDLEKGFSFKAADKRLLIASPVPAIKPANTDADAYLAKTDSGIMKVLIYNEACSINGKEKTPSRKSEVTINGKRYTGCGTYLYNYLLNDIWMLEYIDSKKMNTADYKKQMPVIEFDLRKNKLYGYDGCNNINSNIMVQGNHIRFSPFKGTKKACPNNEAGKVFSSMLSEHTVDYNIKDDELILYLIDDSKLIFKKKVQTP